LLKDPFGAVSSQQGQTVSKQLTYFIRLQIKYLQSLAPADFEEKEDKEPKNIELQIKVDTLKE